MSGFLVDGRCHETAGDVLAAVTAWLPTSKPGGVCFFATGGDLPSLAGSVVSARLSCLDVVTGASTAQSLSWGLPSCEPGFADYGLEYVIFVVALVFAAFSGFRTGYRA